MSVCSRCGATFACAMQDPPDDGAAANQPCWCTLLPAVLALPDGPAAACWCAACLAQAIAAASAKAAPPVS